MKRHCRMEASSISRALSVIGMALVLSIVAACATSKVQVVRRYAAGERLPRPGVVLVYDFAVVPKDVQVDQLGPDIVKRQAYTSEQIQVGRAAANALSEELVKEIRALGMRAERASASTPVPRNALLIKGQFVSIDEGDRLKRMVIGFGAGSSEVKTRVYVYQQTPHGPRLLGEAKTIASGSKRPGLAGPAAVAGATGQVAGVVVGGVTGGVSEIRGGVQADAKRTAKPIAEKLAEGFKRQGWM